MLFVLAAVFAAACPSLLAQSTSGTLAATDPTFTHPGAPMAGSSGGPRYYEAIEFDVSTTGNYTITYTCTGYQGAVHLYQGVWLPANPIVNYWGGVATGSPVSMPTNFSVTGKFIVVLTSAANSATGTWTMTISGPAQVLMGPVVRTCTPNSGSTGGGTPITIGGDFFANITGVSVGGVNVTNMVVVNSNTITCTTGPHAAGLVDVVVNKTGSFGLTGTLHGGFTYNSTPTSINSINRQTPSAADTNAASVVFRVNFAASVGGVNTGNFTLTTTGVAGASVSSVSGSGVNWDVTVNTGTGSGTIRLNMANATSVTPGLTNVPFNSGQVYTIDKVAPGVQSIVRANASPTTAASVQFTVNFTESVTGVVAGNLSLATTGAVSGAGITGVTGSGASRTVTVSTGTGDGTIRLDLLNLAPAINDTAGNALTGAFINGEVYVVDRNPPTVSIGAPSAATSSGGDITYTLTYTDAASISLAPVDISLTVTGTANGTVAISGSGLITRTVTITSITGNGTIGFNVAAGTCLDGAGNLCLAAGPSATFTVLGLPQISIGAPSVPLTRGGPVDFVVTYTNATVVTLAAGDVTVNGAGVTGNAAVTGSGIATRTVSITGITGDGSFTISLAAGTASNTSGAALGAGPSASVNVDNTLPVFTPSPQVSIATGQTINAVVAGSASDTFTTASALVIGNGTLPTGIAVSNIANVAGMVVADFTVSTNAAVGVALVPFTVTDEAGNLGTGNFAINVYANGAPIIDVIGDQTITMNGTTTGLVLTIDDPDEGPNALTLDAVSNNAILMDDAAAYVFGGVGGSRTLAVTARANCVGFATITVTVTDSLGGTASRSFLLTVTDATDAPSLNSLVNVTILRDSPSAGFAFTVSDPQGTAGLGAPMVLSLNPAIVQNGGVNITGTMPNFSYVVTPEAGQTGVATLVFSISDGTHTFSQPITVTVVNPTPGGDDDGGDDGNGCAAGQGGWLAMLALLALAALPARRFARQR